jgi:undecaprenyl phosphate N,N'-diacetylbacillosamine 1-phosphate transferase
MYKNFIKQILDSLIALIGLLLLSPIFLLITVILLFTNKGKPFFLHQRPGKNGTPIYVIKFKSMNDNKDENGEFLPFQQRVTKFGDFIRKYSLDEIPQLINVLKGDMSLVGPRPLLMSYMPLYNENQIRRHNVKPGITGWAQINGRNSITWLQKFELDIWYVENISFFLDVKILLLTVKKVIYKEDINNSDNINMEPFNGTN